MPVPVPVAYNPTQALTRIDVPPGVANGTPGTWPAGVDTIDFEQRTGAGAFVALFSGLLTPQTIEPAVSPGNTYQGRFVYHNTDLTTETGVAATYYSLPATPPDQTPDVATPNEAIFTRPNVAGQIHARLHYRPAGVGQYTVVFYDAATITVEGLDAGTYEFRDEVGGYVGNVFGNVQEFEVSEAPGAEETHCCPAGQFWNPLTEMCESVPGTPTTPDAPLLVSQDCLLGITVQSPAVWPANTAYLQVRRVGTVALTTLADVNATWLDATALTPTTYAYEVRAIGDNGLPSAWSADLTVPTHATDLAVALSISPDDDPASGTFTILAQLSGAGTPAAVDPVVIYLNGTALETEQSSADENQFYVTYDSIAGRVAGTLHFSAIAENDDGCKTAPATLDIDVDNSLFFSTVYKRIKRDSDDTISRAGVWVNFKKKLDTPSDKYRELYVVSPRPAGVDEYDNTEMEELVRASQPFRNGETNILDGFRNEDGTYTPPDASMLLIIKESPIERWLSYDLEADAGTKIRSLAGDGDKLIITTGPLKVMRFTDELTELVDFTDVGLEEGIDAAYISASEQHVIKSGRIYIVDGTAGEKTLAAVPINADGSDETRSILSVERVGTVAYWIFAALGEGTVGYSYEPGAAKQQFTIDYQATLTFARGSLLLIVCDNRLYQWDGEDVTLLHVHTATITGAQILDDGETVTFEDGTGALWTVDEDAADGDLPFVGYARARFSGAAGVLRGAAAGNDELLYLQDSTGAFVAIASDSIIFPSGSTIPALERHGLTILPGTGDPLNGGSLAVIEESLLGIVNQPDGAFLFRYQATRPGTYAVRSQKVMSVVFEER